MPYSSKEGELGLIGIEAWGSEKKVHSEEAGTPRASLLTLEDVRKLARKGRLY